MGRLMRGGVWVAALTLVAHPLNAQEAGGRLDVHIPYTQFTLANGLNVIVHRDTSLPVASVNVWYHVGSRNEKPGRTGFAHLFEHIMFEGSAHVPEGDFDNLLEAAGGVNNGSTANDRTNYWENIPANALELALWLEADRMGFLLETMTQEKLDLQRDVVKNERRQGVDNQPYGMAYETVYENLYPADHPYHWPVIGSMDDLSAATLEDVKGFFRTYYAPNNASLAIAGDVNVSAVRRLVEKYFGDIPAGPPVPEVTAPDPSLSADEALVLEDAVQLPRLYVAWHSPKGFTDEDAALDVLSAVLTEGKSSRLYKRLVFDEQIAQDVSAFQEGNEIGGTFWIIATAKPDVALERIAVVIREEMQRLVSGGVAAEERDRAVNGVETSFVRSLEHVGGFGGKADRLNEYHFMAGTPGWVRQDLARYLRVDGAGVADVARRWLVGRPAVWLSVVPRGRTELAAGGSDGEEAR
ncbi:MAG TPA: pitrilysin family protein [Longimicrobiales bacterium]|nr:pitrilysin family protein [Longimicrobiales bacterium]